MTAPSSLAGCTLSPDGDMRIWDYPLGATYGMAAGERTRCGSSTSMGNAS